MHQVSIKSSCNRDSSPLDTHVKRVFEKWAAADVLPHLALWRASFFLLVLTMAGFAHAGEIGVALIDHLSARRLPGVEVQAKELRPDGTEVWVTKTTTNSDGVAHFDLPGLGEGRKYVFKSRPYNLLSTSAVASDAGWLNFRVGKLQIRMVNATSNLPVAGQPAALKRVKDDGSYELLYTLATDDAGWVRIDPPGVGTERYVLETDSPSGRHIKRSARYVTSGPHIFRIGNAPVTANLRNAIDDTPISDAAVEAWAITTSGQEVFSQTVITDSNGTAPFDLDGLGSGQSYILKSRPFADERVTEPISSAGNVTIHAGALNVTILEGARGDAPYAGLPADLYELQSDNSLKFISRHETDTNGRLRLDPQNLGSRPYLLRANSAVDGRSHDSAQFSRGGRFEFRVGGGTARVVLSDHITNLPLAGVEINAKERLDNGDEVWIAKLTTDASGEARFDLAGFPEHKQYIFTAQPYGSLVKSPIVSTPGKVNFRAGTLQVRVTDGTSGAGVANSIITVRKVTDDGRYVWVFNRVTDADGWLRIDPPAIGFERYVLEAPSPTDGEVKRSPRYITSGPHEFVLGNLPVVATVTNASDGTPIAATSVEAWELLQSGDQVFRMSRQTDVRGVAKFDLDGLTHGRHYVIKTRPYLQQIVSPLISNAGPLTLQAGKLEVAVIDGSRDVPYANRNVNLFERQTDNTLKFLDSVKTDASGKLKLDPPQLGNRPYVLRAPSTVDGRNHDSMDFLSAGRYQFRVGGGAVQLGLVDHLTNQRLPGVEVSAKEIRSDGSEKWITKQTTDPDGIAHFDLEGLSQGKQYRFVANPFGSWVSSEVLSTPGWFGFRVGTSPVTVSDTATGLGIAALKVDAIEKHADGTLHYVKSGITDAQGLIRFDLPGLDNGYTYILQTDNPFGDGHRFQSDVISVKGSIRFTLTREKPEEADVSPPSIEILAPGNGARISAGGALVYGTSRDDQYLRHVDVNFRLPSGALITRRASVHQGSGTWQVDSGPLLNETGAVHVTAVATDHAENRAQTSINLELIEDRSPPVLNIDATFPDMFVPSGAFLLSGTIQDETLGGALNVQVTSPSKGVENKQVSVDQNSGRWTLVVTSLRPDGEPLDIKFAAADRQGNTSQMRLAMVSSDQFAQAWHVLQRASFGANLADYRRATQNGISAWLEEQLTSNALLDQEYLDRIDNWGDGQELATFVVRRMIYNRHQLREVMAWFWENHFNTNHATHGNDFFEIDENEKFYSLALGNFRQLLSVSSKSPAMLYTLNGVNNVKMHANENYARELLELHTLGVGGGYNQDDVEAAARAFTGWSVENGVFTFRKWNHDSNAKQFLGYLLPADGGLEDGETLLDILATHPATARFICKKLVQVFVSDSPEPSLQARCSEAFLANTSAADQIAQVLRSIFDSPEFQSPANAMNKLKTPLEYTVGAVRQVQGDQAGDDVVASLRRQGVALFKNAVPTGYPETGDKWAGGHMLQSRARSADNLLANHPATVTGQTRVDLLGLTAGKGYMTAEASVAALLERALGPTFTAQELDFAMGILTDEGAFQYSPLAPDAEERLRDVMKSILTMPDYHYQ